MSADAAPALAPCAEPPPPPPAAPDAFDSAAHNRSRRRPGRGEAQTGGGAPSGRQPRPRGDPERVEWMLRLFKTSPCNLEGTMSSHDHRCCPYFHNERDRRRSATAESSADALYDGEPCPSQFDDQRCCPNGDACKRCHSTAELLYHPDFFRKRLCHQAQKCPRGRFCAFAHNREELLVPCFKELEEEEPTEAFIIMRFKTQWCPVGGPHDWESCVYAHTYRDWRRIPELGYTSHPCPRWSGSVSGGSAELGYLERCPNGFRCPLAHGAKEQLYHPLFYKTGPCSDSNCRRGPLCAFTHGEHREQRDRREDAAAGRPKRAPIPNAEQVLRESQPTFDAPPMYHALEDAPNTASRSAWKSRDRRGRGRGAGGAVSGAGARGAAATMADTARGARGVGVAQRPAATMGIQAQAPLAQFPQYLCQMPTLAAAAASSPLGPLAAAPFGGHLFGGAPQWGAYMSCHMQAPMVMGSRGAAPLQLPPPLPSYLVAPQPVLAQQHHASHLAAQAPAEQLQPHSVPLVEQRQPLSAPVVEPAIALTAAASGAAAAAVASADSESFPLLPGTEALMRHIIEQQQLDEQRSSLVDLTRWRDKFYKKGRGWRTPSSFGSPPLSGLPSAEVTPQLVETTGAWMSWGEAATMAGASGVENAAAAEEGESVEEPLTPRATREAYTQVVVEPLTACK